MKQNKSGRTRQRSGFAKHFTIKRSLRVPIAVMAVFFLYIVGNFAVSHYHPVETVQAQQISLDDSITTTGYFFREEQVVDVGNVSTVGYNYSDGDEVAKGASLITIYQSEQALEQSQELKDVQDSIDQLETLQNNSYVTNTSQIDQKITTALNSIGDIVDNATFSQLPDAMDQLRGYALKSGSMNGELDDIDSQLSSLKTQESALQNKLSGQTTEISSEYAGCFCQTVDGYESVLTTDKLDSLTVSSLQELTAQQQTGSPNQCKIVSSYVWYYAVVLTSEEAGRLSEEQKVTLRFSQPSDSVSATVFAVRPEEGQDGVLVIFSSQDMNNELVSMRKEVGDVVIASYSGLRVPKEAIHMKDDQMGVYILNDSVASFKSVEPLYEGSDYYIVTQNVMGDSTLVVNDDIIVHAKDIDDKKVVK